MSTVKAHRMVNAELKDVIKDIHGLQVSAIAAIAGSHWAERRAK